MTTREALLAEERDWKEIAERRRTNKIATYRPYPKQREFHDLGKDKRERCLFAGNQNGKTYCGGAEASYHLTGEYPADWNGRRFDRPIKMWAGSVSGEATRAGQQRILCGEPSNPDALGAGLLPKKTILDTSPSRGLPDALDTVLVKHVSGGTSVLKFKSYEQGRQRWQVESVDVVWFDEEPPEDIYTEGISRTNSTGGFVYLTFTPLLGISSVVMRFIKDSTPDRALVTMTIDDAEHIDAEQRAKVIASYPEHERDARTRGIPFLGSGRIFPIEESLIKFTDIAIPDHWKLIGGLDFGWDHPTAAVKLAFDADTDVAYVLRAYRRSQSIPAIHAATVKPWGPEMPWAWPHDGLQHDKGSGEQLAQQYRGHGLKMLPIMAQYENERGNSVEAGLMDMLERMETGRLKVAAHLTEWFEEFQMYHRKDGKVVKERDDLLCATRYALMMLRFAQPTVKAKAKSIGMFRPPVDGARAWMA